METKKRLILPYLTISLFILLTLTNPFLPNDIASRAYAVAYYVDATDGNDSWDGLSPETPWKTISKVNSETFSPGDSVLFKRGEIWREQLIVPSSGEEGNFITFGAYGAGEKPKITAFDLTINWDGPNESGEYTHDESTTVYVFLEDSNNLLRSTAGSLNPGEWGYSGGKIYYKPTSGTPYHHTLEKCIRETAITLDSKNHIILDNLHLEGQNTNWDNAKGVLHGVGCHHITVEDCLVYFGRGFGIRFTKNSEDHGCSDIKVINCITKRNGSRNITFVYVTKGLIKGCTAFESGINHFQTTDDMEGIAVSTGCTDITIEDNKIYNNGRPDLNDYNYGKGIVLYNCGSGEFIIRRNKIYGNQHSGIVSGGPIGAGATVEISYNLIYNNGLNTSGATGYYGGIVLGCWHYDGGTHNIYNNIIWKNSGSNSDNPYRQGNVFAIVGDGKSLTINMKNNIIGEWQNISWGADICFFKHDNGIFTTTSDNNCIYRTTSGDMIRWNTLTNNSYSKDDWSIYQTDSGQDANSINQNPLFVDSLKNVFHLTKDSPCIDAGIDVGLTKDFDGNPVDSSPDIGADEYGPIPEIKVNGLNGPITLSQSDTLTVTVSLNNNGITDNADWWLAKDTPFDLWFFTFEGWTDNWQPVYQRPLFYLEPYEVFSTSVLGLPAGRHTFYFCVDTNMDSHVTWDSLYCDSTEVNVTE